MKITHHIKMRHSPAYYALFRIKRKFELEEFENCFSSIACIEDEMTKDRRRGDLQFKKVGGDRFKQGRGGLH